MSRILILSGSPRKGGNTWLLAEAFSKGASENNEVHNICVSDLNIRPCIGCECCSDGLTMCVHKDDMHLIYDHMQNSDVLVIASPVYFYGISSQLKAVIDRFHTPSRKTFTVKKLALITVGGASREDLFDPILLQYRMLADFFGLEDLGHILVPGIRGKGDIEGSEALERAYELGKSIR